MRQGPLAGRYPAVAAMVLFALIPYLALSAALLPLTPIIAKDLHASLQTMSLGSGLANAAYAIGTVLAVQFAQHLPQRRMLVALRGAASDRVGPRRLGAERGHVHRGPRASGPVHEPAADRRGAAARDRISREQAAHHGDDHEHVHLRGRRARTHDRRAAGQLGRLAAAVLDRRRDRGVGAHPLAADVRRRAAGRPRLAPRSACASRSRPSAASPRSSAHRSCSPTASSARRRSYRCSAGSPDRRAHRLPVPREAPAAHDPYDADEHDARRRDHRRAVRGRRVGLGDRAHRGRAAPALRPASRRAVSTCPRSPAR